MRKIATLIALVLFAAAGPASACGGGHSGHAKQQVADCGTANC